jgi:hypothetical protein
MTIMERAYELAKSGEFRNAGEIEEQLKREGFEQVHAHLSGSFTRKQIQSICSRAWKSGQQAKRAG